MTDPQKQSLPDGAPRQKAVFFCPECSHESPVDGDWIVQEQDAARTYTCPECETVIDTRPIEDDGWSQLRVGAEFSLWQFSFWRDLSAGFSSGGGRMRPGVP